VSRHLRLVPDPEPSPRAEGDGSWARWLTRDTVGPWLEAMRPAPATGEPRSFRRVDGMPEQLEAPGWWVCPSCGRRVDRAGETRTVTGRVCTGPDGRLRHRRHAPVAMEVQR